MGKSLEKFICGKRTEVTIKFFRWKDVPVSLFEKLVPLSVYKGGIRPIFVACVGRSKIAKSLREGFEAIEIAIAFNSKGNPIGWSLHDKNSDIYISRHNVVAVFVKKTYRGNGLAKRLIDFLFKNIDCKISDACYFPWNDENAKFFTCCGFSESNRIH